jgi:hypothetical protein|tara:strand:- start:1651 stop:1974 length:324 start_codon:yes stop_codon:yes gene_type:complete
MSSDTNTNTFINKDDYMLINNKMSASEYNRHDKSVSGNLMKLSFILLYICYGYSAWTFKSFLHTKKLKIRILYFWLFIIYSLLFWKNAPKIAYIISKFIENNLLFNI